MNISARLNLHDLWMELYWNIYEEEIKFYICPVPVIVIRIAFRRKS